jgi:hypothetical protein
LKTEERPASEGGPYQKIQIRPGLDVGFHITAAASDPSATLRARGGRYKGERGLVVAGAVEDL